MKNIGLRIRKDFMRPDKDCIEAFKDVPVANIADNMNRTSCIGASVLKPLNRMPLLGPAFTVKARPGDNLLLNKAIDMASPGDIIVVDGQADPVNALIGELMVLWAKKRGIAGFVINGGIRDCQYLAEQELPVYATHVTPAGPYKNGPGEINFPISMHGTVVRPGDIIVGDQDGIVVIGQEDAKTVLQMVENTMLKEQQILLEIENGTWDRKWVDEFLAEQSCEYR